MTVFIRIGPRPRPQSWGHAVIDWPDGTRRKGWLRSDEAMDYTAGAATPVAALGPDIATAAGGIFVIN